MLFVSQIKMKVDFNWAIGDCNQFTHRNEENSISDLKVELNFLFQGATKDRDLMDFAVKIQMIGFQTKSCLTSNQGFTEFKYRCCIEKIECNVLGNIFIRSW